MNTSKYTKEEMDEANEVPAVSSGEKITMFPQHEIV